MSVNKSNKEKFTNSLDKYKNKIFGINGNIKKNINSIHFHRNKDNNKDNNTNINLDTNNDDDDNNKNILQIKKDKTNSVNKTTSIDKIKDKIKEKIKEKTKEIIKVKTEEKDKEENKKNEERAKEKNIKENEENDNISYSVSSSASTNSFVTPPGSPLLNDNNNDLKDIDNNNIASSSTTLNVSKSENVIVCNSYNSIIQNSKDNIRRNSTCQSDVISTHSQNFKNDKKKATINEIENSKEQNKKIIDTIKVINNLIDDYIKLITEKTTKKGKKINAQQKIELKNLESFYRSTNHLITLLNEDRYPLIALIGRRGSGKSSFVNAILGKKVAELGNIRSQTGEANLLQYRGNNNSGMDILDTRGINEGQKPMEEDSSETPVESIVNALLKYPIDCILYLHKAKELDSGIDADI